MVIVTEEIKEILANIKGSVLLNVYTEFFTALLLLSWPLLNEHRNFILKKYIYEDEAINPSLRRAN